MGIHFTEIIIIAAIALIVMGPDKFPDFAKIFLRTIKDLRGYMDEVKDEVSKEIRPLEKEMRNLSKYSPDKYIDSVTNSGKDSSKKSTSSSASKAKVDSTKDGESDSKANAKQGQSSTPPNTTQYGDLDASGKTSGTSASSITEDTVPEGSDYVSSYTKGSSTKPAETKPAQPKESFETGSGADGAGDLQSKATQQSSATKSSASKDDSASKDAEKTKKSYKDFPPPEQLD